MGVKILNYVLMYFLFSIVGWTVESTYRSLGETYRARKTTKEKKIINSGFLYGPMCPIYGAGALVFEILLTPFKNHWWAVFRLFVDLQVCYIRENRYKGFIELIDSLGLEQINAPLDMATLSNITQDIFRFPFTKWELMIPKDASTRWLTAYTRMYEIADSLKRILITKGF